MWRKGDIYWREDMATRNDVQKWRRELVTRIGDKKWGQEMAIEMATINAKRNGDNKCRREMNAKEMEIRNRDHTRDEKWLRKPAKRKSDETWQRVAARSNGIKE